MPRTVHIIGAGLAGLSAAVRLIGKGERVHVYEATAQAGGRCRSYHDLTIGMTIDNGNHLLLSGNHADIARWRLKQALGRTWLRRPDLLDRRTLTPEEAKLLEEFRSETQAKT